MAQQATPSKPHWSRLRLASLGILSGLFVGILMGIAARIAMLIAYQKRMELDSITPSSS